jgi:hypothetical protein
MAYGYGNAGGGDSKRSGGGMPGASMSGPAESGAASGSAGGGPSGASAGTGSGGSGGAAGNPYEVLRKGGEWIVRVIKSKKVVGHFEKRLDAMKQFVVLERKAHKEGK